MQGWVCRIEPRQATAADAETSCERNTVGLAIRGIRVESLVFGRDSTGKPRISGKYALLSTSDRVLATQPFNEYGGIDINLSPDTIKAMDAFEASIKRDVHATIGIEEGAAS